MTGRVLVVDDIPQNVKLLEAKLAKEYYTVFSCYSGKEALEKTQEIRPDIILLDVMMPEMDGFETCRHLKANPETAHIPVVMVTALSEVEDRIQGLQAGATDFLTKPVDEVHLFVRVRSLVRLKMMLEELRLRDRTRMQFGVNDLDFPPIDQPTYGKILVIDDDIVQSQKIQSILTEAGHHVTLVEPELAEERATQHRFDLVIINTMLDDMDGLRLGMNLRSMEQNRLVPLMILVDEDDRNLLLKGLEIGVDDYIMTPFETNELLARTQTQVRRKKYQDLLKSNYRDSLSAAVQDSLTGLYNRRYLDAHLENIVQDCTSRDSELSAFVIDIDHFKRVNDHPGWGHAVGDEVLKEVALRIQNSVRSTDLATRPGGEEFIVIMPNTSLVTAEHIAERTRERIEEEPFMISAEPGKVNCTVSIGVSDLKKGETQGKSLLKRADEALYEAKNTGRNRVVVKL